MLAEGKLVQGYLTAPDAAEDFRQLAEGLSEEDRWEEMRLLLEAHRAGHTDDPWLAYYQAEVHQHDRAWDKAAKLLRVALKRKPKEALPSIRTNYVFVLYKMGRWPQAHAEIEPHNETFIQLANLMANDKKGSELEALVRVHKANAKDDPEVTFYEARAKVMMKKWAEADSLFREANQTQRSKEFQAFRAKFPEPKEQMGASGE